MGKIIIKGMFDNLPRYLKLEGGRHDRPGESSGGTGDKYSKTVGSGTGLPQPTTKVTENDEDHVIIDPLNCQKKAIVYYCI